MIFPLTLSSREALYSGHAFLGTGFMVAPDLFMTARHVLDGLSPAEDSTIAAVFLADGIQPLAVDQTWLDPTYDIAVGRVVGRDPSDGWLRLIAHLGPADADIHTIEFSPTTDFAGDAGSEPRIDLAHNFRKGHILRHYEATHGHRSPTRCFDVSFPALKGSSGAPILRGNNYAVSGMIVANTERHLMPAHVLTALREDNSAIEEVRYFLQLGQAIHASHLMAALAASGLADDYRD